jgi:hypothetical protein
VRKRLIFAASLMAAGVALVLGGTVAVGGDGDGSWISKAVKGDVARPSLTIRLKNGSTTTRPLPFVSDSTLIAAQQALCIESVVPNCDERFEAADAGSGDPSVDNGPPGVSSHSLGCSQRGAKGNNVRVNQDCTYRRQAETEILYNPADPKNLVAGQNDSRVGYNQCGTDFSTNNGQSWGDELPPFRQRLNAPEFMGPTESNPNNNTFGPVVGTHHTYDAGSDPALAVDSSGRAYFSCVVFDVASNASGLYVTQSPRGAAGSFYFNITGPPSKAFMVAEDNNGLVFHDKQFIAADAFRNSPNRDNVYVTWSVFKFDESGSYQQSPIFGSMSTDHGLTWSTPEDISATSDVYCFLGDALDPSLSPHKCDFNQGSDPIVLPNGDVQVVFNNGNTPPGNPNGQTLGVHCKPTGSSTAGTAHMNCASPTKVGDDVIVGEPQCDFGRGPEECIPGPYIRTNDFPRINTQNAQNNHLYSTWQDYRNGEYDIQMSVSTDGGLTWRNAGTVNPDRGLDHYFPAVELSPQSRGGGGDWGDSSRGDSNGSGDRVGVSYYRSERIPNENTTPTDADGAVIGFAPGVNPGVQQADSDYVLAGGTGSDVPYDFRPVSPVFPPPDGIQAGFNGDYSGLAINNLAHPFWSDTRNVDPYAPANGVTHDEDAFTVAIALPNGRGHRDDHGHVGGRR